MGRRKGIWGVENGTHLPVVKATGSTVKLILKDDPLDKLKVVSYDRWSLNTASINKEWYTAGNGKVVP